MAIAAGTHPFPSRTRQLRPPAPMVLGARAPGRVGRRRNLSQEGPRSPGAFRHFRLLPSATRSGRTAQRYDRPSCPVPEIHTRAPSVSRPRGSPAQGARGPMPVAPTARPMGHGRWARREAGPVQERTAVHRHGTARGGRRADRARHRRPEGRTAARPAGHDGVRLAGDRQVPAARRRPNGGPDRDGRRALLVGAAAPRAPVRRGRANGLVGARQLGPPPLAGPARRGREERRRFAEAL